MSDKSSWPWFMKNYNDLRAVRRGFSSMVSIWNQKGEPPTPKDPTPRPDKALIDGLAEVELRSGLAALPQVLQTPLLTLLSSC